MRVLDYLRLLVGLAGVAVVGWDLGGPTTGHQLPAEFVVVHFVMMQHKPCGLCVTVAAQVCKVSQHCECGLVLAVVPSGGDRAPASAVHRRDAPSVQRALEPRDQNAIVPAMS